MIMLLSMSELYIIQSGSLVQESRSTNGTSSFFRLVRDNCPPTREHDYIAFDEY